MKELEDLLAAKIKERSELNMEIHNIQECLRMMKVVKI